MSGPTGEDLYQELDAEAQRRGIPVRRLAISLWPTAPGWKLEQLRIAKSPTSQTIDRVRRLIAGELVEIRTGPPLTITRAERASLGLAPSAREIVETRQLASVIHAKRMIEERIAICRLAHDRRMPGETLEAAAARLERELLA